MITNDGRFYIKRFLSGQVGTIGDSIALGLGGGAELATDTFMNFETARAEVTLVTYDFNTDRLIFKAVMPDDYAGTIYELGLWSNGVDSVGGTYESRLLMSFDSDTEEWTVPTGSSWSTAIVRLGSDALRHSPGSGAVVTSTMSNIFMDLSGYSGADTFMLAYNVGTNGAASIRLRLYSDASNYAQTIITSPTAGYKITSVAKSAFTVTGVMDWGNIISADITTTANAGLAAVVDFDGLRIEDRDRLDPDDVLVSRELLSTPYTKAAGTIEEIEFSLAVSIT